MVLIQRRTGDGQSHKLATSNLNYLYWTPYQQITHYALAGCGLETGDLFGTGTITGEVCYAHLFDDRLIKQICNVGISISSDLRRTWLSI